MTSSEILIREARPEDAEGLVDFVVSLSEETDLYIVLQPGEFTMTVDEEAKLLEKYAAAENSVYFIVEAFEAGVPTDMGTGNIIGGLNLKGGGRAGTRHRAVLGMSVASGWRDQGVGTRLLEKAIEWARGNEVLKRLELYVFVENKRAIHLYEKHGFIVEGRMRNAIFRHDRYYDDLIMALVL